MTFGIGSLAIDSASAFCSPSASVAQSYYESRERLGFPMAPRARSR